ncbi:unnamed protein product [Prunus armeniaca]
MEFLQGAGIRVSRSERLTSTTFVFLAPYAHLLRAAVSFEDLADFVVVVAVLVTDVDDFLLRLTRSIIRLENARNAAIWFENRRWKIRGCRRRRILRLC